MTVPIKDVYEELKSTSSQLSERTRTIAVSIIALVWVFLAGGDDAPTLPHSPDQRMLLGSLVGALFSLLLDYLQFLFGYLNTDTVRKRAEAASLEQVNYNYRSLLFKARTWAFWLKQVLALISLAVLFVAIGRCVFVA